MEYGKVSKEEYDKFLEDDYASDEECLKMRDHFIKLGIITPGFPLNKKDFEPAPPLPRVVNINNIPESGTYRVRPIMSDQEYERRKQNYFYTLQSVLRTREEEENDG